mgnify:CR=1 FL=1
MGFDLFLAAVSIVAASIATWALLRLFPSSDARQAIPLRTDGGFADPSHTTDGGVTIDGKVTADGESTSDIDGQPTDHLGKRLVLAREQIAAGMPVLQAAGACGFGDYSAFCRAYRRQFGQPPSSAR